MRRMMILLLPFLLALPLEPQAENREPVELRLAPLPTAAARTAAASAATSSAAAPPLRDTAFVRRDDAPDLDWGPCPPFMPDDCRLAVIQAVDADGRNADAFFKLEPGTSAPEHWHTSPERMVLLSGVMEVDYEGQDPVTLAPGTYAYGPPELPHEAHCLGGPGDDACILFIAFEQPVDAFDAREDPDRR